MLGRTARTALHVARRVVGLRLLLVLLAVAVVVRAVDGPGAATPVAPTASIAQIPARAARLAGTAFANGRPTAVRFPASPELAAAANAFQRSYEARRPALDAAVRRSAIRPRYTGEQLLDGLFGVGPLAPVYGHTESIPPAAEREFREFLYGTLYPAIRKAAPDAFVEVAAGLQSGNRAVVDATMRDLAGVLVTAYDAATGRDLVAEIRNGSEAPGAIGICFFGVAFIIFVSVGWLVLGVTTGIELYTVLFAAEYVTVSTQATSVPLDESAGSRRSRIQTALELCKQCNISPRESRLLHDRLIDQITSALAHG